MDAKMPTVREAIRMLERDGWVLARTRGSHKIFRHPNKPGIVVVAGNAGLDLPTGTWKAIPEQARLE